MHTFTLSTIADDCGINLLTSEACAFSMRILCDVNEDGRDLVREYLGLPYNVEFAQPMNSQVAGKPSVASVMLTRETLASIMRFKAWLSGYQYALANDYGISAFSEHDLEQQPALKAHVQGHEMEVFKRFRLLRNPRIQSQPSVGSRNVHAFTGRVL